MQPLMVVICIEHEENFEVFDLQIFLTSGGRNLEPLKMGHVRYQIIDLLMFYFNS